MVRELGKRARLHAPRQVRSDQPGRYRERVSAPLKLVTNEPAAVYGKTKAIRDVSRRNYGRPVAKVEREMEARRKAEKTPSRKRPKVSGEGWGTDAV